MAIHYSDLTLPQKEFAFYLFTITENGGIDSDIKWAATNYGDYGDPITVGVISFTGDEFPIFGEYVRDNYPNWWAEWPQTWKDDIATYGTNNHDFWWYRYITYDENEQYKVSVAHNLNDAKAAQITFFFVNEGEGSLKWWVDYMVEGLGIEVNDIKRFMYYLQICQLAPYVASGTYNIVGDADIDTLRDCAIAYMRVNDSKWDQWGEGWTNRFADYAYWPIVNWDGVSAPESYGVDAGTGATSGGEPGNAYGTVGINIATAYLANGNQDLILVMSNGEKMLMRRANSGNVWIPTKYSATYTYDSNQNNGQPGTNPPVVPISGGWPYASQLLADFRAVDFQWEYSQPMHSYDPWQVEATDCSGLVWWGVNKYDPTTAQKMTYYDGSPGNTTIFQQVCSEVLQYGYNGDPLDTSIMLPGDLVLCNYSTTDSYMEGGHSGSHVAMWFAPGVMYHMFPSYGPHEITEDVITDAVLYWEVRRMPYTV